MNVEEETGRYLQYWEFRILERQGIDLNPCNYSSLGKTCFSFRLCFINSGIFNLHIPYQEKSGEFNVRQMCTILMQTVSPFLK